MLSQPARPEGLLARAAAAWPSGPETRALYLSAASAQQKPGRVHCSRTVRSRFQVCGRPSRQIWPRPNHVHGAPASHAATWAWAGSLLARLGRIPVRLLLAIGSDPTAALHSRLIKTGSRSAPFRTLDHFHFFPLLSLSTPHRVEDAAAPAMAAGPLRSSFSFPLLSPASSQPPQ